jgi:hypothetical protein
MYCPHPALYKLRPPHTIRNNVCEPSDLRVLATYTTLLLWCMEVKDYAKSSMTVRVLLQRRQKALEAISAVGGTIGHLLAHGVPCQARSTM